MEILKYFPRENLNITISEIMEKDTDKSYQNIFKFLNIKEYHSNFNKRFVSKTKNKLNKDGELYLKLQKIFDSDKKKLFVIKKRITMKYTIILYIVWQQLLS